MKKEQIFLKKFEDILRNKITPRLNDIIFCLKYPTKIVKKIIKKKQKEQKKNQKLLANVNEGIEVDLSDIIRNSKNKKKKFLQN